MLKQIAKLVLSPWVRMRGPRGRIYLTFDDGPNPVHTRPILEILKRHDIKATFFMVGEEMERHPDIVTEVISHGHAIGFHSYRHQHVSELSPSALLQDLRRLAVLARSLDLAFTLYRPPYGEMSPLRLLWCILHGVKTIMWSHESRDSFVTSMEELVSEMSPDRIHDGDILLMHDDTAVTAQALPTVLETLRDNGYRFGVITK